MLDDKYVRAWYAEFREGSYAETDWKVGSKVNFKDESGSGMTGKIIANKPNEILSIELEGMINKGKPDYDSEGAQAVKGSRETYRLSEKNNMVHLAIETGMAEDYFEEMSASWDKALQKIKELSESEKQLNKY